MNGKGFWIRAGSMVLSLMLLLSFTSPTFVIAQGAVPEMLDSHLGVRPVITGLVSPTSLAFLGSNDFLVLEKSTGKVQHVVNRAVQNTALDLAVNNSSERGLLGITLDPNFMSNHFVYLYWTCQAPHPDDPFTPSLTECANTPDLGADANDILAVPLL